MLGSPIGLIWNSNNKIPDVESIPNDITTGTTPPIPDCVVWYDFTDQSTIYKDNSGLVTISADENIGRIQNKAAAGYKLGSFLRSVSSSTSAGDIGGSNAPTFKLNGEKGLSYAEFDSTGFGGSPQCLVGSNYYSFGSASSKGHGGGTGGITHSYNNGGWYAVFLENNYASSPNNNWFSLNQNLENTAMTVFWVVKPSTSNPSGTGKHTHWLIRPDDSNDSGEGRSNETYFEGRTNATTDKFTVAHNDEENNTIYEIEGTSATNDVTTSITVLTAIFGSGTNASSIDVGLSGALDTVTITNNSFNMRSGMMCLGRWSLGNINSGAVSDSGYDGEFYEIIVFDKELSGSEIAQIQLYLQTKYY